MTAATEQGTGQGTKQEVRYLGKYRGIVASNIDPLALGRLLVQVPDVLHVSGWLLPEQFVCPGAHRPVQTPPTHVWFEHAVAPPYVPFDWHVCTLLPAHVS